MKELSLNILDIAMNSVKAGATDIEIKINETEETMEVYINDNGCGMTAEQLEKLSDPFFTSRTTRKVGLGIPFYRLAAEQTGGKVEIKSVSVRDEPKEHGTSVYALFYKNHIDFTPLGDIISTIVTLVQGNPDINWVFLHDTVRLSVSELKGFLEGVPINSFEVLEWIKTYLEEQYKTM